MRIDVLTLFPEMIEAGVRVSLLGKAIQEGILEVAATNIRDFAADRHRTVDDAPYGGGAGMVMKCEPIYAAVESLRDRNSLERIILLSPSGRRLDQRLVRELASARDMVLLCARHSGRQHYDIAMRLLDPATRLAPIGIEHVQPLRRRVRWDRVHRRTDTQLAPGRIDRAHASDLDSSGRHGRAAARATRQSATTRVSRPSRRRR